MNLSNSIWGQWCGGCLNIEKIQIWAEKFTPGREELGLSGVIMPGPKKEEREDECADLPEGTTEIVPLPEILPVIPQSMVER